MTKKFPKSHFCQCLFFTDWWWILGWFGRSLRFRIKRGWGWRVTSIRGFEVCRHLRFCQHLSDLIDTASPEDTTDEWRDFFTTSQLCQLPGKFQSRRQELHARNLCSKFLLYLALNFRVISTVSLRCKSRLYEYLADAAPHGPFYFLPLPQSFSNGLLTSVKIYAELSFFWIFALISVQCAAS